MWLFGLAHESLVGGQILFTANIPVNQKLY